MRKDFAVFILTHGRPHNQDTLQTLQRAGYKGKIYLVVDDLDDTLDEYKSLYDNVLVFDKMKYVNEAETGLSQPYIKFALFARNAIEDMARDMGLSYFVMADDDLIKFRIRYPDGDKLRSLVIDDMDKLLETYIDFMEESNVATTCFASHLNFIGGVKTIPDADSPKLRMCFNFYLRSVKYEVKWLSNICHDRITSIVFGRKGQIWLQVPFVQYDMRELYGINNGGNSDTYRKISDFHRSFFPVVFLPDCNYSSFWNRSGKWVTSISDYDSICPKIVSSSYTNIHKHENMI